MLPLLVGSLSAAYAVGRMSDNVRYWSDYKRNTGYSPRYPWRAGANDWMKYAANAGFSYGALKNLNKSHRRFRR